ncbi:hypothetical protein O6P43_025478 [Quillaja saponaria]|uniref:Uncharacterized protein n=1 Tax=Quillaja saponaria TaxID=32244 RepID=A0AAD7L9P1_QUISA|nr:hypothetical protein O6P43_025478 [Quillaja saponaria]
MQPPEMDSRFVVTADVQDGFLVKTSVAYLLQLFWLVRYYKTSRKFVLQVPNVSFYTHDDIKKPHSSYKLVHIKLFAYMQVTNIGSIARISISQQAGKITVTG